MNSIFARWTSATILALQLAVIKGYAQPTVEWLTVAGTARQDVPSDMALSSAGELLVTGNFDGRNGGFPETVLIKFDTKGKEISRQDTRGELIRGVAVDARGNYYLTGQVWDPNRFGIGVKNDFYLAKYSPSGALLWERATGSGGTVGYHGGDGGSKIALDLEGNIYVAGTATGAGVFGHVTFTGAGGPLLCKYDPDGTLLWVKRLADTGGGAWGIALDPSGKIVVAGYLKNSFFVAKHDAQGNQDWIRSEYGGDAVAVDSQGNIFVNGGEWGGNVMLCSKLAPTGESIWSRRVTGVYPLNVKLNSMGEPIFTGQFSGTVRLDDHLVQNKNRTIGDHYLISKADANGRFQWALGGNDDALVRVGPLVADAQNNIYVAGSLRFIMTSTDCFCDKGSFGPFPLTMLFGGIDEDMFIARLSEPPSLVPEIKVTRDGSNVKLSWSSTVGTGYFLESANVLPATSWTAVSETPSVAGGQNAVTVTTGSGSRFYRLRKP